MRYQRNQVAERGGVPVDFVNRLVDLGILAPGDDDRFSPGDVRRAKLVHTLEQAGVSLDGLSSALRSGVLSLAFVDAAVYSRLAELSNITFAELSRSIGVPVDLLMMMRETIGSAQPQPVDRVREDELLIAPFIEFQVGSGVGRRGVERLLRIYGDSLRRIAESEADWWHTEMIPVLHAATGPTEILEAADQLRPDATELSDQAVQAIYHAQQAHAWTKSIIESVEIALENAGLYTRPQRVPAISFLDVTGYTRLTEERGDEAAAAMTEQMARIVERISIRHGGQTVKRIGDGMMLYFPEPGPGVMASLEMVEEATDVGLPPTHVGLHAGPVLFQDGDYYGRTVNVAARIADHARPGEVLVSQDVVDTSGSLAIDFSAIGPVELKGVSEPTRLWTAKRNEAATVSP